MGRKQLYNKAFGDQLAVELNRWTDTLVNSENASIAYQFLHIEKFCFRNNVNVRRIKDIENRSAAFRESLSQFREMRKMKLQEGGLFKHLHPSIVRLLLSHEYKVHQKVTSENEVYGQLSSLEELLDSEELSDE